MCEIISVQGVTKVYGRQQVLKNVFLSCVKGRIYGLVGRNGSGKTVLLKCICGIVQPTSGEISVWGKRIGKDVDFPENIGFIIETPGFLPHESGLSNLKHLASIQRKIGLQEIRESMELVGLDPDLKKPVGKYSMGMRQRLGIAQAIMEKPKLLILDEPMNGLDNQGVEHIRSVLLSLKENGVTSESVSTDMFLSIVRKYTRAKKLTPRMLNELVNHIEVHQAEKNDGEWVQKLTIHYNCVGALFIPDTEALPTPEVTVNTRRGVYVTYEPAQNE